MNSRYNKQEYTLQDGEIDFDLLDRTNQARVSYFRHATSNFGTSNSHWPRWLGFPVIKYPTDMIQYQQIFYETRPELIIECGTAKGGSGLFFATMMDLLNIEGGSVVSTDINNTHRKRSLPKHPRLIHLNGSTLDKNIFTTISEMSHGKKTMAILDSDHSCHHVTQELELYHSLVTPGQYLVVEDTNLAGPYEAIKKFLLVYGHAYEQKWFERQIMFSSIPGGWLLKK